MSKGVAPIDDVSIQQPRSTKSLKTPKSTKSVGNVLFSPRIAINDKLFVGSPRSGFGEKLASKTVMALKNRFTNKNEQELNEHMANAALKSKHNNDDDKKDQRKSSILSMPSSMPVSIPVGNNIDNYNNNNINQESTRNRNISASFVSLKSNARNLVDRVFNDAKLYFDDSKDNNSTHDHSRTSSFISGGVQYQYQYPYYKPNLILYPYVSPNMYITPTKYKKRNNKHVKGRSEPVIMYKHTNNDSVNGIEGTGYYNPTLPSTSNIKRNNYQAKQDKTNNFNDNNIKTIVEVKQDINNAKTDLSDIIENENEASFISHQTHSLFSHNVEPVKYRNKSAMLHSGHHGHRDHHHGHRDHHHDHRGHHHGPLTPHHIKFGVTQDWETHTAHKTVNWYELFTDLIFVCIIIKMTKMYEYLWKTYTDPVMQSRMVIGIFVFHFAFFVSWLEMAVVQTRFVSKKKIYIFMKYLYFTGVVTMGMQLDKHRPATNSLGFSYGLLICFITHMAIHFHLCTIPRASLYCLVNICITIVCSCILLVGIFFNHEDDNINKAIRMGCIFICCLIIFIRTSSTFSVDPSQIPVNVHHFAERFGLLMMLYIGESIISLLLSPYYYTPKYYYIIHLGFLNIYIIRIIYYNLAHAESKHRDTTHALRNAGNPGAKVFVTAHIFLSFGLVGDAIGLKLMAKDLKYGYYINPRNAYFFVYAHVFVQLCILLIRHTHQKVRDSMLAYIHLFFRFVLTIVVFPLIPRISNIILEFVTLIVLFTLFFAVFDVILIKYIKKMTANDDSKVIDFGETMKKFRESQAELNPKINKDLRLKTKQQKSLRDITKDLAKRASSKNLNIVNSRDKNHKRTNHDNHHTKNKKNSVGNNHKNNHKNAHKNYDKNNDKNNENDVDNTDDIDNTPMDDEIDAEDYDLL